MTTDQSSLGLKAETERAGARVIGVGDAGLALLASLPAGEFAGAELVAVNMDVASLAQAPVAVRIALENRRLRGLGSGGDPERSRRLAEDQFEALRSVCEGAEVVFLLAGLGGGTASGAVPVVARAAREAGALVLAFVTLPFGHEGDRRMEQAQRSLDQLRELADGVISLPGNKTQEVFDENTELLNLFPRTDEYLAGAVRGVWRLLAKPGLVPVRFPELAAVMRDRHADSAFACVTAAGAGRSREVMDQLLAHPLLDKGKALAEAVTVVVSITGGKDLSLAEVNRVHEQMRRQCGQAQLIMGAAVDPALKDRLSLTVIASREAAPLPAVVNTGTGTRTETRTYTTSSPASTSRPSPARRKTGSKMVQPQLPLSMNMKGRFDNSEPTLHNGQNLDEPTYLRRGVLLN